MESLNSPSTMKTVWSKFSWVLSLAIAVVALPARAEKIDVTLLQLNDVYEITPVSNGKSGGLARVATLRKQLKRRNPNLLTILAGDCLNPSALGTAKIEGEPLAGQQMVAVLNAMGLNLATFGNHEFDLTEPQFLKRLQESKFTWISSNVTDVHNQPFESVRRSQILTFRGKGGKAVRIGLIGLTLDSNPSPYVKYGEPFTSARREIAVLKPQVDVVVALTHLALAQDQKLAETIPEIDIILGGHEHENNQQWRGTHFTPIFKADANARSVYIHRLAYDTQTKHLTVNSQFQPITDQLPEDPQTALVVNAWVKRAYAAFRQSGFQPEAVVATVPDALDGLESSVRNRPTALTQLIAASLQTAAGSADVAIFNGGSIRIDDILPPGPISQYDIIRILPFGGKILLVNMRGDVLQQVLNQGLANQGTGGYLQAAGVDRDPTTKVWIIKGKPLQPDARYQVALNDFLVSGKETGLSFLTLQNPGIELVSEHGDIRFAVIKQLQAPQALNRSY